MKTRSPNFSSLNIVQNEKIFFWIAFSELRRNWMGPFLVKAVGYKASYRTTRGQRQTSTCHNTTHQTHWDRGGFWFTSSSALQKLGPSKIWLFWSIQLLCTVLLSWETRVWFPLYAVQTSKQIPYQGYLQIWSLKQQHCANATQGTEKSTLSPRKCSFLVPLATGQTLRKHL